MYYRRFAYDILLRVLKLETLGVGCFKYLECWNVSRTALDTTSMTPRTLECPTLYLASHV